VVGRHGGDLGSGLSIQRHFSRSPHAMFHRHVNYESES
jgi:hypothetical protein